MADPVPSPERPRRIRWIRWTAIALMVGVLTVFLALAALPSLLSSDTFRHRLEREASRALGRPVQVGVLELGWTGVPHLGGVRVEDDPAFSGGPLMTLDRLEIHLDPAGLVRGRLSLSVRLTGLDLNIIRDRTGYTNLEALLATRPQPSSIEPQEPVATEPASGGPPAGLRLPFRELDLTVRLDHLNLRVDDRAQGRVAAIRDLSLHLDAHPPEYPIAAELSAGLEVDGDNLGPVRLAVTVEHLLAPGGTVDLGEAQIRAEGEAPGFSLAARGGPGMESEANGEPAASLIATASLDLQELWASARPFLPPTIAGSEVGGNVELNLQGKGNPDEEVSFLVALTGDGLRASGAVLDGLDVGPADLNLEHRGRFHVSQSTLVIEQGRIGIQQGSRLEWRGKLDHLDTPTPQADLEIGPVRLDLGELYRLAQAFLPPEVKLAWRGPEPPGLGLERISLEGPLAGGAEARQDLELRGLILELPDTSLHSGDTDLELRGAILRLEEVSARLQSGFPSQLSALGSLEVTALDLNGADPLELRDLTLSPLQATARGLRPPHTGDLPLGGQFELAQGLSIGSVRHGSGASVDGLKQRLTATGVISEEGRLQIEVEGFSVRAEAMAHAGDGERPLSLSLSPADGDMALGAFELALSDLALSAPASMEPDTFSLRAMSLGLGQAEAATGEDRVALGAATLSVEGWTATLQGGFPRDFEGRLSTAVEELRVDGANPAQAARLELPSVYASARGLGLAEESLFGVVGTFRVDQSLAAEGIRIPGMATAGILRQDLTVEGTLDAGATATLRVPSLNVSLRDTRVETPEGPLTLPLAMRAHLDSVRLTGTRPEDIDVDGLSLQLDAGPLATLSADADADGLGARTLRVNGAMRLDAAALTRLLPAAYRADGRFSGLAEVDWALSGRLPSPGELETLGADAVGAWASAHPLPFLDGLEFRTRLTGLGVDLPQAGGDRLTMGGVFTEPPLQIAVGAGGGSASFSCPVEIRWLEALPGLPPLRDPLRLRLGIRGELGEDGTLKATQDLAVEPLGVEQTARFTVRGIRRLLAQGLDSPPAVLMNTLGGEAEATLKVVESPDLGALAAGDGVHIQGPLAASIGASLTRGEAVTARLHIEASDATVRVGDQLLMENLDGAIDLDKRVSMGVVHRELRDSGTEPFLSEAVLRGAGGPGTGRSPTSARSNSAADQGGGLRAARVRLGALPVPLQLDGLELQVSLPDGLPSVDRLQAEMLGGTVLSSMAFVPTDLGYALDGGLAFTGLSTERLAPTSGEADPGEAEVSGQLGFRVPLDEDLRQLLSGLELQFRITQVGPRTLGRALYALDPTESNEAILEQRRLVQLGRPLWAATEVRNGNLSLNGEVELLGAKLSLPAVDRVPVADLPGMLRLQPLAEHAASLINLLDLAAADHLAIHPNGELRLTSDPAEE